MERMKRMSKRSTFLLALLMFVFAAWPAGLLQAEESKTSTVEWDNQNPTTLNLGGNPAQLKVWSLTEKGKEDVTQKAEWISGDSSILKVDKGLITPVSKGQIKIVATYEQQTVSTTITVKSPYSKLQLNPSSPINLTIGGESKQLTAQGVLNGGGTENVSGVEWTSSNTAVATVENGLVRPLAKGVTYIKASKDELKAQTIVYVRSSSQALVLSATGSQSVFLGSSPIQVSATDVNLNGGKTDVTNTTEWTSSNPLVATVEQGKITPMDAGNSTVTASYHGLSKTLKINVLPTVEKLVSSKASLTLETGGKTSLPSISAYLVNGAKKAVQSDVKWSLSSESAVKIANGKLVAVNPGSATLTATVGALKLDIPVTVQYKILKLTASEKKYVLVAGQEASIPTVKAHMAGGGILDVTNQVSWVGTTAAVTVANGKVKAVNGGNSGIKAMYMNKYVKVPVIVEGAISTLTPSFSNAEMNLKGSKSIKVIGIYTDGKKVTLSSKVKWTTSNASVAIVKGSSIKAVGIGNATITGTYQDKSFNVEIKVTPKLLKLVLSNKNLKLPKGSSQVLSVNAVYDSGATTNVTSSAVWTSSKPSIVEVTAGQVKALDSGSSSIKVVYGGKKVTTSAKVLK
ncbi:Ig-like domain-containing protein [Paenibacillus polymyxa]|uniref:Ig-like domain-containing protein n=1 Tax=Paenibacillus polymyxa TaxID=1406 RepID=UPI0023781A6A|nr:Ig-like domain-containing protein [Paenibacillus polymyxa]WDM20500.1 Ig-like domain-containing protein [Paenibacillus polymyxa]